MVPSTSGYTFTAADLFDRAMAKIGGEEVTGYAARVCRTNIQLMFEDWGNRGVLMWRIAEFSIPLEAGRAVYPLPADLEDMMDMYLLNAQGVSFDVERIGRTTYARTGMKQAPGRSTQGFVNRQRDGSTITLYPVPTDTEAAGTVLTGYYIRRLKDVNGLGDDLDMPRRFRDAAVWGLAFYMGSERAEVGADKLAFLDNQHEKSLLRAMDADRDRSTVWLIPDLTCYSRI